MSADKITELRLTEHAKSPVPRERLSARDFPSCPFLTWMPRMGCRSELALVDHARMNLITRLIGRVDGQKEEIRNRE